MKRWMSIAMAILLMGCTLGLTLDNLPGVSGAAPVISTSDQTTAAEDSFYTVDYDATDGDLDELTWSLNTDSSFLSINSSNGWLNGTPVNDDVGTFWVNVTVSDGTEIDWSNFTLTVTNVNDDPVISTVPDLISKTGILYSEDFEATDVDPTSDILAWDLHTNSSFLSIVGGTGVVSGTPAASDIGDWFANVSVTDGKGGTDWVNYTVNVSENTDPVITTTTPVKAWKTGTLYSEDFDATDADTMDVHSWSLHTNASFLGIVDSTGVVSGTASDTQTGLFFVNVTVKDDYEGEDWLNYTLNMTINHHPVITTAVPDGTATEEVLYFFDFNATDSDTGDTLTWSMTTNTTFLSINSTTGNVSGTPGNSDVGDWFFVNASVNDGFNGTTWVNYTLNISNVNDEPVITTMPGVYAKVGIQYSEDFDATDVDPGPDTLTWALNTNSSFLSIVSGTGVVSGTPGASDVGDWFANVSVNDGNTGLDWYNYTINVSVNNDPVITTITPVKYWKAGFLYSEDFDATDADTMDIHTWALHTNSSFLDINTTTGVVSGVPLISEVGIYFINVTVEENYGGKDWFNYTLDVSINTFPDITSITPGLVGLEDSPYSYDFEATDSDTGDTFMWSIHTDASFLVINSTTGMVSGTPENGDVGTSFVNVSVSDGFNGTDWINYTIVIGNTNDDPVIDTIPAMFAKVGFAYSEDFEATDIDPTMDTLTWALHTNASFLGIVPSTGVLSGTPLGTDAGIWFANVSVDDGVGGADWINYTINVTVNEDPVITTTPALRGKVDVDYTQDFDATDVDPYDTHTWALHTNSSFLSINTSTGVVSGTPTILDTGLWFVNVSVDDGFDGVDWINYTLNITENDIPVIITLPTLTGKEDELYSVDFDASDDDTTDTLVWSLETDAGFLSIDTSTGVVSGTPLMADVGEYYVNVTVDDGFSGTDWVNYTLNISAVNDDPEITTTSPPESGIEDVPYLFDFNATDEESTNLTWSLNTNATFLSIDSVTGNLTGTPGDAGVGTWFVNVTVTDWQDAFTWINYTLVVSNVNDDPVITTTPSETATEDILYSESFVATDDDPTFDTLTWSMNTDASFLSFVPSTGVLSGTPSDVDVGTWFVNVSVTDGNGGMDWINYTLRVVNVNDDPVITTVDVLTATEDVPYSVDYDFTDDDPTGSGDVYTWSLLTNPTANWLSIDSNSGVLSGTPLNADVGTYSITVSIRDGQGGSDSHKFDLVVANVNDDPVISNPSTGVNWNEDEYDEIDFDATDEDPTMDTLTWALTTDATWLSIDPNTGILSGTPGNDDVGDWEVNVTVTDGHLGMATNIFTITVDNVNDDPTIDPLVINDITEDQPFWQIITGDDIDPTSDVLQWSIETDASFLAIDEDTGNLSGTPGNDDVGEWWVNISVQDGNGGSSFVNVSLTVLNVNDDPVIETLTIPDATEDMLYFILLDASDIDPTGDSITWTVTDTNADFIDLYPTTGNLSFNATNADVGDFWVVVKASDPTGGYDEVNLTFSVINVNDDPVIETDMLADATEDEDYWFILNGSDIDPTMDTLEWSIGETNASFISLDEDTGNLSGTPGNMDVGTWWINITLDDGVGGSAWVNLTITVVNVNDAPALNQTTVSLSAEEDSGSITLNLNDVFVDPDGDSLTFGYTAGENFTVAISGGVATITPVADFSGTETIRFTADDGETELGLNVTVEVQNVNDSPSGVSVNQPSSYKAGQDQTVTATATDPDGDTLTFTWSSNVSGQIGTGSEINLSLAAGDHTITLNVTDGSGGFVVYTFDVNIQKADEDVVDDDDDEEDDEFPWLIVIIVIVVIIVIGIILFLVLGKKDEDEESSEMPPEMGSDMESDLEADYKTPMEGYEEPAYDDMSEPPMMMDEMEDMEEVEETEYEEAPMVEEEEAPVEELDEEEEMDDEDLQEIDELTKMMDE